MQARLAITAESGGCRGPACSLHAHERARSRVKNLISSFQNVDQKVPVSPPSYLLGSTNLHEHIHLRRPTLSESRICTPLAQTHRTTTTHVYSRACLSRGAAASCCGLPASFSLLWHACLPRGKMLASLRRGARARAAQRGMSLPVGAAPEPPPSCNHIRYVDAVVAPLWHVSHMYV